MAQRNVEIKAILRNREKIIKVAKELSKSDGIILIQKDVFFNVLNGRLKLRYIQDSSSELIYYNRGDKSGPKLAEYQLTVIENGPELESILGASMGVKSVVEKNRLLFKVEQTRIHIDEVITSGLGSFIELEVVLHPDQSVKEGEAIANDLMEKLGIRSEDLLCGAYADMLTKKV